MKLVTPDSDEMFSLITMEYSVGCSGAAAAGGAGATGVLA